MKKIHSVLAAAAIATCPVQAQDTTPKPDLAASTNGATQNTSMSPEERAQYAELIRGELESGTQLKLLDALADEQLKRSTESRQSGAMEKAKWEAELRQEYLARSSQVLEQLNGVTKQRLAFEESHGKLPAPAADLGVLGEAKALTPNEHAYVTKLDERLLKVRQELALCDEAVSTLYSQLLTNTAPEAVAEVSRLLDLNTREAKQWERDQADLELRKLEFRALRR